MNVVLPKPGRYVVAVSGGVDSLALLHRLSQEADLKLTVAHFDHGIRDDSIEDRKLVQKVAGDYGLPFVYQTANLGVGASEARARQARYEFLEKVRQTSDARAIITAHHQDDVIETAIINIIRGSGRKGLSSLGNRPGIERPLLDAPKSEIIEYAETNNLQWREDSTNTDTTYLRNHIRHNLLPKIDAESRSQLLQIISDARSSNDEIDSLLDKELTGHMAKQRLDRQWFIDLPHAVALEVMAAWLRQQNLRDFDSKTLDRLVVAAKVATPGSEFDALNDASLTVWTDNLALEPAER